jgi:hypothetical protein
LIGVDANGIGFGNMSLAGWHDQQFTSQVRRQADYERHWRIAQVVVTISKELVWM